jgi:hypothetical protein
MFPLSHNFLKFAAAGALVLATAPVVTSAFVLAAASTPAQAGERVQQVGPDNTIMTTFGSKGVIAFYESDGTHCGIYAVVYDVADESGASAAQIRMSLNALQVVTIDSPDHKSLALKCGENAESLAAIDGPFD